MSESTTTSPVPTPAAQAPTPEKPASGLEVAAHLVAALVIGSVAPFLVSWTSPAYAFGVTAGGFELVDIAPQLVAVLCLGIGLLARVRGFVWLRSAGWLVAALGLFGLAGLYAQGNLLDGQWLTIGLVVVISLQVVGLLFAFARAAAGARWAVAVGLAAGITGGREVVALLVRAVRQGPMSGSLHGDDVVLAGLAVLVVAAGLVLLVLGRGRESYAPGAEAWPAAWWTSVRWPALAVAVASVLAVVLTRVWNARLESIAQSYIGGISEEDSLWVQTQDQLVRVGIAVLVAAVLAVAAQRSGGWVVARWVLVAFGTGLLLVGLQGALAYEPSWPTAVLGIAGAAVGAVLVRRLDAAVPWEAIGLLLASALLFVGPPAAVQYVGVFGFGLAVAAAILRLTPDGVARLGPGAVSGAAALGLAAWVLCHQVVVPAAASYRTDLGGVPILPFGVMLAAVATVGFFLLGRSPRAAGGPSASE
jgi:hypothetical protein